MDHAQLSRRRFIHKATFASLLTYLAPYSPHLFAKPVSTSSEKAKFLQISCLLTGYDDLETELSDKYYQSFVDIYPEFEKQFQLLAQNNYESAKSVVAYANNNNLQHVVNAILQGWFTGTVGPNEAGKSKVVAFRSALMYRPASDGIPVPTYCFNGPLWFTALPPGITREPAIPTVF